MYPAETKEKQYQMNKKVCTEYIPVHTVFKTVSMYHVHTFKLKYVLQNIHFLSSTYWYVLGTYWRKKVCTRYIHGKKVCTEYIPVYVGLQRYHTAINGTCRFMSVPYYSMVHTGLFSVHTGMNFVHTTGHDSRCLYDSKRVYNV